MGLSTSLNTAVAGLNTTQIGIGVVSQNVANAGTAGYVRRAVSTSDTLNGQTVGTQSTQVQRLLDKIVQHQLWQESAGAAYTSTRAEMLSGLDQLYGAPGSTTALDSIYSGFTSALQALQNDPSSYSLRTAVLDTAGQLAARLNTLSDGVQTLRSDAENGIASGVTQVNNLLDALTNVNARIVGTPNDAAAAGLKDQRDLILSELSQFIDIKTTEDARGSISIVTGSGTQIFDGRPSVTFGFDARSGLGADDQWSTDPAQRGVGTITMTTGSGGTMDAIANKTFRSGEIAALVEMRDKTLVQAQGQLDEIASQMAKALSDHETKGVVTGTGVGNSATLAIASPSALSRGNTITLDYKATATGPTQRVTLVNASAGTVLPATAVGDASNRVIAVDLSGTAADIATAIQAALVATPGVPAFTFTNPTGNQLLISAPAASQVVGGASYATNTVLTGGGAEIPLFVDGGTGGAAFTGSYEGGSQALGFAGRITVNQGLIADRSKLVVFNTTPGSTTAQGDATRPKLMLEALTQTQRSITNRTGLDGSTATTQLTVANLVQRVVSSQGQAVETAKRLDEGQQVALAAIQSRFQDTAQVNVDQEMAQLIELQTAYAANARIISTVKEMMDLLMRV